MPTREEIQEFLDYLTASEYRDEAIDLPVFPNIFNFEFDMDVIRCTSGAMMVAKKFDGKVFGYRFDDDNDEGKVAFNCGGHDFAIVGNFLVDWWAKNVEDSENPEILDMTDPDDMRIIEGKYRHRDAWEELELWDIVSTSSK